MRDPRRIERISNKLEILWNASGQELRFGQMLINNGILPDTLFFWNLEDDNLEKMLDIMIQSKDKIIINH